jgi:hypothetical protein
LISLGDADKKLTALKFAYLIENKIIQKDNFSSSIQESIGKFLRQFPETEKIGKDFGGFWW